jgi:hypothetical protein
MKPSGGAGRIIIEPLMADSEKRHNHTQVFMFPFPTFNDDDDAKNKRAATVNIITALQFVVRARHTPDHHE